MSVASLPTKPLLCVDIDNVVSRTDDVLRSLIADATGGRVCLQHKDVQVFDYRQCKDSSGSQVTNEEWTVAISEFWEPHVILSLQPHEYSAEALNQLSAIYDIHFVTSRPSHTRPATLTWLSRHRFPYTDVHFFALGAKHKAFCAAAAIEDNYDEAVQFASRGVPCFVHASPWNIRCPRMNLLFWFDNWNHLLSLLLSHSDS